MRGQFVRPNWLRLLIAFLGALYLYIGLSTAGVYWYGGILGGIAVIAGSLVRFRTASLALIILGVIPLALLAWWSIVTPLIALMALLLDIGLFRKRK